jgi:hypothetical protein
MARLSVQALLVLIGRKHRWVRKLIKVWSGFMMFAGALGLC